jgi:hypothetical protein
LKFWQIIHFLASSPDETRDDQLWAESELSSIKAKGEERMTTETQGKATNSMDNQAKNKQKILRMKTGALSVLSYSPMDLFNQNSMQHADFNLLSPAKNLSLTRLSTSGWGGGTRARSK